MLTKGNFTEELICFRIPHSVKQGFISCRYNWRLGRGTVYPESCPLISLCFATVTETLNFFSELWSFIQTCEMNYHSTTARPTSTARLTYCFFFLHKPPVVLICFNLSICVLSGITAVVVMCILIVRQESTHRCSFTFSKAYFYLFQCIILPRIEIFIIYFYYYYLSL